MSEFEISPAAEAIWLQHLSRRLGGEPVDFDQLRAAHPRFAHEFERLESDWQRSSQGDAASQAQVRDQRLESVLERLARLRPGAAKYELRGEIGRGGMGVVQRVWDDSLKRELAMKTVHASFGLAREQALARFVEEAQILAQLDHPAIVPIHDLGVDEHGRPFFVMKLVVGRDLGSIFTLAREEREGWSTTRALDVLLRVCEAVGYAHRKGVVHRDLKPSNVMVGDLGEVYVMDWGIARVLRDGAGPTLETVRTLPLESGAHDGLNTGDGVIVGTVAYMAPEQARGELSEVNSRSDVYALGAMLYELLAGRAPYAQPGASSRQLLLSLLAGPPEPLARAAPKAPPELIAIAEQALSRDASKRYADLAEVALELRAYLEGRVVRAHRTGSWAELVKWVHRNRALALVSAAATLSTLVGAALIVAKARELRMLAADMSLLADIAEHDELERQIDELWPLEADIAPRLEAWIERATALVSGRSARSDTPSGLAACREALERVRARAAPITPAEIERDRREHPLAAKSERLSSELQWRRRMAGIEPWPDEQPEREALARDWGEADSTTLERVARERLGADWSNFGHEIAALVAARAFLERAEPAQQARAHQCLAMALYKVGRFSECELHSDRAVALGESRDYPSQARLRMSIASFSEGDTAAKKRENLERELAGLQATVSERRTYRFETASLESWHRRASEGVERLQSIATNQLAPQPDRDPRLWTIPERLASVLEVARESVESPQARARWAVAREAIRASTLYAGLELQPQFGLVPLGPDPRTGLWEFAHLLSGTAPSRGEDGDLELTEDSAIVLVLAPGGVFVMGAQSHDREAPNHDPDADDDEGPTHEVTLRPFFIGKYEVTWGQWERTTRNNARPPEVASHSSLRPACLLSWELGDTWLVRSGLSLPTEAQWEYAARGGASSTGPSLEAPALRECANLLDRSAFEGGVRGSLQPLPWSDGQVESAPIGGRTPNRLGIHDTAGNVFEWCLDEFAEYENSVAVGDGRRTGRGLDERVLRGGAYSSDEWHSRVSFRYRAPRDYSTRETGLRAARMVVDS